MWASQVALVVKNWQCRRHKILRFYSWVSKLPWRRAWETTPIVLPVKFHGQRGLVGYSLWGLREPDITEATEQAGILYITHVRW